MLRPVQDLCRQRRAEFETQGKTRTKNKSRWKEKKRKEKHFVIIYEKKEGRKKSEKRREKRKELGDRWTKADDKKRHCFMIYEITKGNFPWEHYWTSLNLRTSWISKRYQHKTYKPKRSLRQQLDSVICVFLRAITARTNAIAIIHSRSIQPRKTY